MTVLIPINTTPAPSRVDTPNFAARADVYHAWLPTAVDAMNAQNTENNAMAVDVTTKSAAAVVAAAVVTSANPIANAAAAAASAATAASAMTAASASSMAAANARDAAIAAAAVASAPTEQLSAISQSIHRGTVVKSIIYDTSKDSDGGAWRKRCTDKSWYNETLGGTSWVGQQPSSATARAYIGSLASPELVTNGTFTTDTSGWTSSNATLSVVGGQLQVVGTGGTIYPRADLVLTLIVGRTYHVQFEITTASTQGITILGETLDPQTGAGYYYPNAIGTYTLSFVATNTTRILSLVTNSPNTSTGSFDNVSVKIVDPAIATVGYVYQSKSDNKFYRLETSGTTEVRRGLTREFPALAAIVVETLRVVIYDLTQASCPMWMVFLGGDLVTGGLLSFDQSTGSYGNLNSSVAALNGSVYVTQANAHNGQGLRVINFITDTADRVSDPSRLNTWRFKGNISRRNNADGGYQYSSVGIVNLTANDVAVTVLDTAPIDPATGLPVPTIAVATAGGVSVIKDDGTVTNHTASGYIDWKRVGYTPDFRLWAHIGNDDRRIGFLKTGTSTVSTTLLSDFNVYSDPPANGQFPYVRDSVFSRYATAVGRDVYGAGSSGVFAFKTNPSSFTKSMQAQITNTYNTGWLPGDIRGAYLADTTAETITASGELVTNGTFTTDTSGWNTGNGNSAISSLAGKLRCVITAAWGGAVTNAINTVIGRTYTFTGDFTKDTVNVQFGICTHPQATSGIVAQQLLTTSGTYTSNFVATTTVTYIYMFVSGGVSGNLFDLDNVSLKLAEPDRSVKSTGLVINGTLTKTAVASGAGLVAYSGFSASNYLEQPYNSNLDFGTGDFCVMGWANITSLGQQFLFARSVSTTNVLSFYISSSGIYAYFVSATATAVSTGVVATTGYHKIALTRAAGVLSLWVDGVKVYTVANTENITNTAATLKIGVSDAYSLPFAGSMALWRISATAPSADQIAHIYRTELPLFQPNAQCTLAGTSTAVTALAYDDVTDELHVGTSWGRSEFHDLLRVASEATTTGAITSLSANEGTILTGGTSARVYAPALVLRDELAKPSQGPAQPQPYQQFSVKDQQVFLSQAGVKIVGVYIRGVLKKLGIDYTVTSDGFRYIVTTTDKLASRTEVTLLQVKE